MHNRRVSLVIPSPNSAAKVDRSISAQVPTPSPTPVKPNGLNFNYFKSYILGHTRNASFSHDSNGNVVRIAPGVRLAPLDPTLSHSNSQVMGQNNSSSNRNLTLNVNSASTGIAIPPSPMYMPPNSVAGIFIFYIFLKWRPC